MDPNYFFVRNTTFLARQYNWSNMFNTIRTCRLSHYFRLKTCSSFLSHSQVFHLMFVTKYVTVLSGKYPANFARIPDGAGCLHFTGYRIVLSGSGTSLMHGRHIKTMINYTHYTIIIQFTGRLVVTSCCKMSTDLLQLARFSPCNTPIFWEK